MELKPLSVIEAVEYHLPTPLLLSMPLEAFGFDPALPVEGVWLEKVKVAVALESTSRLEEAIGEETRVEAYCRGIDGGGEPLRAAYQVKMLSLGIIPEPLKSELLRALRERAASWLPNAT